MLGKERTPEVSGGVEGVCLRGGEHSVKDRGHSLSILEHDTVNRWIKHTWCLVRFLKHCSAVKINIICYQLVLGSCRLSLITHASLHLSDHMLWPVITECLRSSHINTCVKQHGVASCTTYFFLFKFTKSSFWLISSFRRYLRNHIYP